MVLLTGASGGIGQVMTAALLAAGHAVAAVDRDAAALARLAAQHGGVNDRLHPIVADLATAAGCDNAVAEARARFGAIDAVINNAGIGMSSVRPDAEARAPGIAELTPEIWDRFMAIFVRAPVMLVRAALPDMTRRGFGRIVNNTTSYVTMLRVLPYGAAKAALEFDVGGLGQGARRLGHHRQRAGAGRTDRYAADRRCLRLAARQDAAPGDHGPADGLAGFRRGERVFRPAHHGGALGHKAQTRRRRPTGKPRHRLARAFSRRGVADRKELGPDQASDIRHQDSALMTDD